jgi:hypothetical protein
MVKEFRAEMRRTAYAQIAAMKQERIEELERKSANIQLEIAANGIVSPEAKAFFDSLPKVDELIPPVSAKEIFVLMEGRPHTEERPRLYDWQKRNLPEYQPDLVTGEED